MRILVVLEIILIIIHYFQLSNKFEGKIIIKGFAYIILLNLWSMHFNYLIFHHDNHSLSTK